MSNDVSATNEAGRPRQIVIYSHSALFYWWPVWAVGFIMGILTFFSGDRLAIVPDGSVAARVDPREGQHSYATVVGEANSAKKQLEEGQYIVIVPPDKGPIETPHLRISRNKNLGVVFTVILLIVIVVTNVPLRGVWSLVVILLIILLTVIFALAGWWGAIMDTVRLLQIYINAAGYFLISGILFAIWAISVFVFDRRTYVIVTSGQIRACQAIGAGETVYDTTGMTFHKRADDLFRHWIIGLGSGDLIIQKSATHQEIDMPNVLFIGSKIKQIERLIKEKQIVT
ncbi:MAG: hypothetical protein KatS3mg105_0468 [Gemmatales bacterium]|nr:MAG: hypothetical protein KatS3mg105_0468 [Gemmatales bacterium]